MVRLASRMRFTTELANIQRFTGGTEIIRTLHFNLLISRCGWTVCFYSPRLILRMFGCCCRNSAKTSDCHKVPIETEVANSLMSFY